MGKVPKVPQLDKPRGVIQVSWVSAGNAVVGSVAHILHGNLVLVVGGFLIAWTEPKLPGDLLFGVQLCQKAHDLPVRIFHQLRLGSLKFLDLQMKDISLT
ncbi:hypothetical protein PG991_013119 [Apiospora marii]|uniref:Uncharacterized protein n=1 Tax=Apiospora marii TaxID=335849 RepID=A0ABR1R525_9PEZI